LQRGLDGSLILNQKIKIDTESREQAAAVNKYIESFIRNPIKAGQRIGECGGTPEGRREFIDIG